MVSDRDPAFVVGETLHHRPVFAPVWLDLAATWAPVRAPAAHTLREDQGQDRARADTAYARLREHFAYLGLTTAAEELAPALERANQLQLAPVEVLENLMARDAEATRAAHGSPSALRPLTPAQEPHGLRVRLPALHRPQGDRRALHCGPPRRRDTFRCWGRRGSARRILGVALGIAATEAGYRTYFTIASDLAAGLQRAHLEGNTSTKLRTYAGPSLLMIDELGYSPMDQTSAHWIFQVVSRRYERGSIVLTSNRGFSGWGAVFAGQVVAATILERLLHHATVETTRTAESDA